MLEVVFQFIRWVFRRFAGGVVIVALAVAVFGLWLYLKDPVSIDDWQHEIVRSIDKERAAYKSSIDLAQRKMDRISAEMTAEQEKGKQADKIIANLRELQSTWDKYTGNAAQQKANDQRIESLTTTRLAATAKIAGLQQEFNRATWERDALEASLGKLEEKRVAAQEEESTFMRYAERTWNYEVGIAPVTLQVQQLVVVALVLYFVGPMLIRVWMYFSVAPWVARRKPIRIARELTTLPDVGDGKPAVTVTLQPGQRLWVRNGYRITASESVKTATRSLLDWRVPISCLSAGLTKLTEVQAAEGASAPELTMEKQGEAKGELAVITLLEGASLVLRPSFLVGVITTQGQGLKLRRRWQLFRFQVWVTRQFRFFEFSGPCQLIVASDRGVRVEQLLEREDGKTPARRVSQEATMGFTPNLNYRPARTETFRGYFGGVVPLFDNVFAGKGIFLRQPVVEEEEPAKPPGFWAGMRLSVQRAFGI
jgi:hypothetical protein